MKLTLVFHTLLLILKIQTLFLNSSEVIVISKPWRSEIETLIKFWKMDPFTGDIQQSFVDFKGVKFGIFVE